MECMSAVEPNQANFSLGPSGWKWENSFASVNATVTTSARVWVPPDSCILQLQSAGPFPLAGGDAMEGKPGCL